METRATGDARSAELDAYFSEGFSAHVTFAATAAVVDAFAALSGDRSSLHTDEAFAGTSMYRQRVVHGMLPVVMIAALNDLVPEALDASLVRIDGKFSAPAFVDDRITVRVWHEPDRDEHGERAFGFDIRKGESDECIASGSFCLRFAAPGLREASLAGTSTAALPADLAGESGFRLEELSKGQIETFRFRITQASEQAFASLAAMAIGADDSSAVASMIRRASIREVLALTQFSTLVGMRLPGRAATFLNFSARFDSPVQSDCDYDLVAKVGHVSKGAGLLRADVEIRGPGGVKPLTGSTTVLVHPEGVARKSMSALRGEATSLGLDDKVVLVTGATGGIGETIAKLFSMFGARVVVHFRSTEKDAERVVADIVDDGGKAIAIRADITDPDDVARMFAGIEKQYGPVDVLVNNAVRNFAAIPYEDVRWDDVQRDIDVAVKGAFLCCQAAIPGMRGRGGKIVNISSVYADNPPRDQLKYAVSKAALEGLSRALAAELADSNIQVNAVVPGFVDTDVASRMHAGIRRKMAKNAPMGRNAKAEEVAQAVVFLASDFASYTTGQRLMVTGGAPPFL